MKIKIPNMKLPNITMPRLNFSFGKKSGCVGIVLEDYGMRYAEVRHNSSSVEIKQAGLIEIESGIIENGKIIDQEKVITQLSPGIKEANLAKKKAVLAVPTSSIVLRKVALPVLPLKEVRPFLEVELQTAIHLPFSRPYFDFYKLKGQSKMNDAEQLEDELLEEEDIQEEYLLIAAPGDLIDEYRYICDELDIELTAVDIEPLALYRFLNMLDLHTDEESFMFVQLGLHTVNVSFFKNEIPEFARNIPLDLTNYQITMDERSMQSSALLHFLKDRGMYDAFIHDLFRELERVLNFYQFSMKNDGTRVEKIYLTGDFPDLEKIKAFLQARMQSIKIEALPLDYVIHSFSDEKEVQGYTVSLGLSMKG